MGNIAPAYLMVNPSYTMPELILPYQQASGAFETLPEGEPLVRLGEGDLFVYMNRADVRTRMTAAQGAGNELPSVTVALSQISTPTYLLRVRAEYDHHDTAAMARRGVSIVDAQRLGMRQGHFQLLRTMLLNGMNPSNGEGLLNANGAVSINLPADTYGHDTVQTYDNGQMAFFLLSQVSALKTRTMQMGMGREFVILGPQRILGAFEYQNIVQLTQFQRIGAGTSDTKGVLEAQLMKNGDRLIWTYDDTLIGQGNGGADAVILVMPEVEKPKAHKINTNEFALVKPGYEGCTLMLTDMLAPKEISTPLAGGAVDVLSEMRATPGWALRPEALTIISMNF